MTTAYVPAAELCACGRTAIRWVAVETIPGSADSRVVAFPCCEACYHGDPGDPRAPRWADLHVAGRDVVERASADDLARIRSRLSLPGLPTPPTPHVLDEPPNEPHPTPAAARPVANVT
jgi:hypothetical protein